MYTKLSIMRTGTQTLGGRLSLFPPFVSRVDLVFRVPSDKNTYVLLATSEAIAKPTTVKIEVDAVNAASTAEKTDIRNSRKKKYRCHQEIDG